MSKRGKKIRVKNQVKQTKIHLLNPGVSWFILQIAGEIISQTVQQLMSEPASLESIKCICTMYLI